jgi:hypothetical protein
MPTNYDQRRRIGSVVTNGSGAIRAFTQYGDDFYLTDQVQILNGATPPTTNTPVTVISPLGVRCKAILYFANFSSSGQNRYFVNYAIGSVSYECNAYTGTADEETAPVLTNTSSQVYHVAESATNHLVYMISKGWTDRRGQDG